MSERNDQNPAIGWFYGRWRKVFKRLDKVKIDRSVKSLGRKHPKAGRERLVRMIIRRSARLAAAAGVVSTSPALMPGLGLAISVAGIVPEEIYMMRRKCTMVLQLAATYGYDVTAKERFYELIALVGDSPRAVEALITAKDDLSRMSVRVLAGAGRKVSKPAAVGAKVASRGVVRFLPALGLLAGGAMNYYAFVLLGRRAAKFYENLPAEPTRRLPSGDEEGKSGRARAKKKPEA